MSNVTARTEQRIVGTYGEGAQALTITYRRLIFTWTVEVYQGVHRVQELCRPFSAGLPAYREAQRIARAAHQGQTVEQIIADQPAELVLAEVARILDTVPAGEHRAVRPTMAGAHLAGLTDPDRRTIRHAANNGGRAYACRDFPRPVLRALVRKGYGDPIEGERKHDIAGLTLNARGWREAQRLQVTS